jgi:alkylated DNA repair protein (DNA oxidative demethylase)
LPIDLRRLEVKPHTILLALDSPEPARRDVKLGTETTLLASFAAAHASDLLEAIDAIARRSPFRHMITPGGWAMSVAMTSCGAFGWVTNPSGYRYDAVDPTTEQSWPPMPALFSALAARAASASGFPGFSPDACLINRYQPGAHLSLHQDRDEQDLTAPVVSVSLGLPANFLWGGQKRAVRPIRIPLWHGDVVVWGGVDRLTFHGVSRLADGEHPLTGALRYNLTFRKAR